MKQNGPIKILAADDENAILNSLRRIFVEADYIFVGVDSGSEGVAVLRQGRSFDVIISDYRMPGMNGIEFLTFATELQPESLRILLSGQAPGKEIVEALNSGVISRYIEKPWNNDELIALIENLVV
ncbi:MAG: response regulator [Desulfuromonadaceae bacterium]|nr:response regulator [Desulfuromonadaceae bacterium]